MHPLGQDLTGIGDDELQKKLGELQRKLLQASRFGPFEIVPQIQMIIEDYQWEINERNRRKMEEMEKRAEQSGRGFKGIIDIQ
jgi:hypothetical protein